MSNDSEQGMANIRDQYPRLWWNLYQGCVTAGFARHEAMALLQTYILAQNGFGGVKPPQMLDGPKSDAE